MPLCPISYQLIKKGIIFSLRFLPVGTISVSWAPCQCAVQTAVATASALLHVWKHSYILHLEQGWQLLCGLTLWAQSHFNLWKVREAFMVHLVWDRNLTANLFQSVFDLKTIYTVAELICVDRASLTCFCRLPVPRWDPGPHTCWNALTWNTDRQIAAKISELSAAQFSFPLWNHLSKFTEHQKWRQCNLNPNRFQQRLNQLPFKTSQGY